MRNQRNLWILVAVVVVAIILFLTMRPMGSNNGQNNAEQPSPHAIDQTQ